MFLNEMSDRTIFLLSFLTRQLFGREYYHGCFAEPWLVFAPLSLHVCAGILKRILSTFNKQDVRRLGSSPINLLTASAYPLVVFLSIHVLTNRLIPSTSTPPIQALSPSELDYDYVKIGLMVWPFRSTLIYGSLLISTALHGGEGVNIILRTWLPRAKRMSAAAKRLVTSTVVSTVVFGLVCIAREPFPILLRATQDRILASYRSLWIYGI